MRIMYSVRENPPQDIQKTLEGHDELTQRLLYARGITTQKDADLFLRKVWEDINPYIYADMRKAAERILTAVAKKEIIGIYGDYDCDGIPAAAALYSTLRAFGHNDIVYHVPDRNRDGFGLNTKGIQHLIDSGVTVACILDCGTSDPDGIAQMRTAGIDTVVIDHHLPGKTVPDTFAMLNPTLEKEISEPHPCAAGITYFFIQALILQAQDMPLAVKPKPGWEKWQLDVVCLATLSDMVPLRGINRQIAHYGLSVMRKSPRPGIHALCEDLKINQRQITQDDLTFLIVPRINAASRMGDARIAFNLLTSDDVVEAKELVKILTKLNNKRKTTVATMVRETHKHAEKKNENKAVWVFGNRTWKPSLVGLVAQKLVETYGKTIFVWGQEDSREKSVIRGSCRSAKHNTFNMMQEIPDLFVEAGGHAQAGGFTLTEAAEITLEDRLNETLACKQEETSVYYVDSECVIGDIQRLLSLCERFAPFGAENEQVRVAIPKCTVRRQIWFGKNKEHIRYVFSDDTGEVDGISFFAGKKEDGETLERASLRAVIGLLEWDFFRNRPRVRVKDIVR